MEITKRAYAKINLTLEILHKRPDGYHEMQSVMHKIPIFDEITVTLTRGSGIELNCNKEICPVKDNLAYKAAKKYLHLSKTDETYHVEIGLTKMIPSQAGLAGGSADGAAVLDALFQLIGKLSYRDVEQIAAELGSDVPFCLEKYTCAVASGTGTTLTPIPSIREGYVVVALPKDRMSTAKIYALYDAQNPDDVEKQKTFQLMHVLQNGGTLSELSFYTGNDFQPICFKLSPDIKAIRDEMVSSGAVLSQMSGSGAAVFGLFDAEEKALSCVKQLLLYKFEEISCNNLNIFPNS